MNLFWQTFESSWGNILIVCNEKGLIRVSLPGVNVSKELNLLSKNREVILNFKNTSLIQQTKKQIEEYFLGERENFCLNVDFHGTEFQKQVWKALLRIPYGETRCYQDVAVMIRNEKAVRAVGMANNKNPIPIIVPCHRVIGKSGDLVGYGGGLGMKKKLLNLEKSVLLKKKPSKTSKIRQPLVHANPV